MTTKMMLLAAVILVGTGTTFGVVKNDKNRVIDASAGPVAAVVTAAPKAEAPKASTGETKAGACCTFSEVKTTVSNDKNREIGTVTHKAMTCAAPSGCKSPVENLLTTGKFEHACSMAGMEACH